MSRYLCTVGVPLDRGYKLNLLLLASGDQHVLRVIEIGGSYGESSGQKVINGYQVCLVYRLPLNGLNEATMSSVKLG